MTHSQKSTSDSISNADIKRINGIAQISPNDALELLKNNAEAQLIDVRTEGEWKEIGIPDLHSTGKALHTISWLFAPSRELNPEFDSACEGVFAGLALSKEAPLLFLCKGGSRSQSAAEHFMSKGYTNCMNIEGGFQGKTAQTPGWAALGLPKGHYA